MLTAKFRNAYSPKAGGIKRAWYVVSGSSAELEAYKTAQGSYLAFDEDGVTPLINSDCPMDESITYKINILPSGRYYVDFSMITAAAGAIENAEKRGNALLAGEVAKQAASRLMGTTVTPSAASALQAAVAIAPEPAALDQPIAPSAKK
jgi:hypothetical protein